MNERRGGPLTNLMRRGNGIPR